MPPRPGLPNTSRGQASGWSAPGGSKVRGPQRPGWGAGGAGEDGDRDVRGRDPTSSELAGPQNREHLRDSGRRRKGGAAQARPGGSPAPGSPVPGHASLQLAAPPCSHLPDPAPTCSGTPEGSPRGCGPLTMAPLPSPRPYWHAYEMVQPACTHTHTHAHTHAHTHTHPTHPAHFPSSSSRHRDPLTLPALVHLCPLSPPSPHPLLIHEQVLPTRLQVPGPQYLPGPHN